MWTSLALAAALSVNAGQTEQLVISNVRPTFGLLGAERPDDRVVPGDTYLVAFEVSGFKIADDGKVVYTMAMEINDSEGKLVHGRDPRDLETYNSLGSGRIQAYAIAEIPLAQPAGEYTMKVTVTDRVTKASQTFTRKFEVLKKAFALVGITASYDPDGRIPAPPGGVVGQMIWLRCHAVSFARDSERKQPNVYAEMVIKDAAGNPTVAKPVSGVHDRNIGDDIVALPMSFALVLNRPGKFTVELSAKDRIAKKETVTSFPFTVIEQKAR
jgi:hypothetical protein